MGLKKNELYKLYIAHKEFLFFAYKVQYMHIYSLDNFINSFQNLKIKY